MSTVTPGTTGLYAIRDRKAEAITGPIMQHKHVATALRLYHDLMLDPQSIANKHPEDYDLIRLGWLHEDLTIEESHHEVMTGKQWLAEKEKANNA